MRDPLADIRGRRPSPQALAAALATLIFIAISIWWLLYDRRLPGGGDPGRHVGILLGFSDLLADGDLGGLLGFEASWGEFFYPPLVHLVGSVPAALGLAAEDWGTIAVNLVFVPLLAAGCYGVGRTVYGPTAGLLATVFALGSPMVLSLFHVFLLDAPLAGSVAITLWALLASERFSRTRESVLAGALLGVALLVKTPAPLFVAGPMAVMLIGGGWRQWKNLALLGAATLVVAGPYYLIHLGDLLDQSAQATAGGVGGGNAFAAYDRFSLDNFAYYGWVAINIQYLVPLLVLFAIGAVSALREIRRRPHLPELFAGLIVGYLGPTLLLDIRDPRYTLPLVVFVAVLATGWITTTRRALAASAAGALLAATVVINVGGAVTRIPTVRVTPPWDQVSVDDVTEPGRFTLLDDRGYTVGAPHPDPLWDRLLDAAESEGIESARILVRSLPLWGTDELAFDVAAQQRGIATSAFADLRGRPELRINIWPGLYDELWMARANLPPPCAKLEEGSANPPFEGPVAVSVLVERLGPGGYRRWCEF